MRNPFRYFNSSLEVMKYIRCRCLGRAIRRRMTPFARYSHRD